MYILGTVRLSLLHVIMMRILTLPVVRNITRTAFTAIGSHLKEVDTYPCCFVFVCLSVSVSVTVSISVLSCVSSSL